MRLTAVPLLVSTLCAAQASGQDLSTVAASRQLQGEDNITVSVRFAAGRFVMTRDQGESLYRATVQYDERDFRPILEYDAEDHHIDVGLRSLRDNVNRKRDDPKQRIDLAVAPSVPMALDLEFGAGHADIDLGGMSLQSVDMKTGASETRLAFSRPTLMPCDQLELNVGAAEFVADRLGNANCEHFEVNAAAGKLELDFTGEWQHRGTTTAKITIGLGGLELRFPSRLGVAIELDRFLASFEKAGFEKRGDTYYSSGYDAAPSKLHIELKAVMGDVNVVWVK
jgi:N-terminal domain of toast_rack, DUF2154